MAGEPCLGGIERRPLEEEALGVVLGALLERYDDRDPFHDAVRFEHSARTTSGPTPIQSSTRIQTRPSARL